MSMVAFTVLRRFASRERNRPKEASYGFSPTGIFTSLIQPVQEQPRCSILASSHFSALAYSSVEQIGDFCNPNPVQNFHWVFRSDPNPEDLSIYLIQSGLNPKNPLIKHFIALISAVWISISDPVEFLSKDTICIAAFYVLRAARKTIFIFCCHVTSVGLAQFNSNMYWLLFFQLPGTIHN